MEQPSISQGKDKRPGVLIKVLGVVGIALTGGSIALYLVVLALGRMNHNLSEGVFIVVRTSVLWGLAGLGVGVGAGYKGKDRLWAACAGAGVIQIFDLLLFVIGATR